MKTNYKIYAIGLLLTSLSGSIQAQTNISLVEALGIAKENNKSLQIQKFSEEVSTQRTLESRGAMLPTLDVRGNYSYYLDRQVIFMPGAFAGNASEPVVDVAVGGKNAFNTMATLHQPIISEVARNQIKSSKINERVQTQTTKELEAQLVLEVSVRYYMVLLIDENIRLNRQSLERNVRSLQDSRSLFKQGKALKVDTLSNFIAVENIKTSTSYLESQHDVALLNLKQLIGLPEDQLIKLSDSLQHDTSARYFSAVGNLYEGMLENRPDIQRQKMITELNRSLVKQTQAQRLPVLSVVGAYQLQAQTDNLKFSSYNWPRTSYLGLQASIPVFSGNRINSQIRQASIHMKQSETQLTDATEKAKVEIVSIQNKLMEAMRRLDSQERTVDAALQNFQIIHNRYGNGLSSRLELSDAEIALSEAKLNYTRAVYDIKITKLELDKALGILTL